MRDVNNTSGFPFNPVGATSVATSKKDDPVNHPSHYTDGKIEVIEFVEDKQLTYHLGNVVKYVCRAGKKNPEKELEDLRKAQWYLNRHIELIERRNSLNARIDRA